MGSGRIGYFDQTENLVSADARTHSPIRQFSLLNKKIWVGKMTYLNEKSNGHRDKAHLNFMGAPSYDLSNPLMKLRIAASSCFFGEPMYYNRDLDDKRKIRHASKARLSDSDVEYLATILDAIDPREWRKMTPKSLMEKAIDDAIAFDAEKTLQEAVRLRNEDYIRVTPQVILVRVANYPDAKGTGLVKKYGSNIARRPDDIVTQLAYQLSAFGKTVPNALKRLWKLKLESYDAYQLAKYRMENRKVKMVDVNRFAHAKSEHIDKLVKEELKNERTWESIISSEGSNKESWKKAIGEMGHMALLRNIRNFLKTEVEPSDFVQKLKNGVKRGMQLPFRYYSAYQSNKKIAPPTVLDAIEECLELSLDNLPHFDGKVMSLCDNSGSAHGTMTSSAGTMKISSIANLSAVITGKISDEGYIGIFGDELEVLPVRKKSSTFELVDEANRIAKGIGQSTENGIWLFWDKAIEEKQHWDKVFVYSDMQAGHGGLFGTNDREYSDYRWRGTHMIDVPKLINQYRSKVNKDVEVFLVQVAGYQDTIIPEFYKKTYILGGWGDGIYRFADKMSKLTIEPTSQ